MIDRVLRETIRDDRAFAEKVGMGRASMLPEEDPQCMAKAWFVGVLTKDKGFREEVRRRYFRRWLVPRDELEAKVEEVAIERVVADPSLGKRILEEYVTWKRRQAGRST